MRLLLAAIILASITVAAAAQMQNMPTTLPLIDNNTKENIGTATVWGGKMILRKSDGTFIAQVIRERDGTRTLLDEHGKVLDQIPGNLAVPNAD